MTLFPRSTNGDYRGSAIAPWALTLLALLTIVPGGIHAFLPDGGSVVIAGLDISANPHLIVGVFNWLGATQIGWGLMLLAISLRYRNLVPLALLLVIILTGINATNQWILRFEAGAHHPPEMYASLITLPLVLGMLWLSLTPGKTKG
ncbi:MAG: hypothetical protein ABL973_03375 [Micropepsaceae bacterium]